MQVLVLLHEGKFYVSVDKETKELPSDYNPDDYWTEWEGIKDFEALTTKLWDLLGLGEKADD